MSTHPAYTAYRRELEDADADGDRVFKLMTPYLLPSLEKLDRSLAYARVCVETEPHRFNVVDAAFWTGEPICRIENFDGEDMNLYARHVQSKATGRAGIYYEVSDTLSGPYCVFIVPDE